MGDTMREDAKAHCGPCESRCHDCPIDWEGRPELQAAFERGRQLGMEQARREHAQWQQPGPVTPEHPLDCLIVLQSLRQSDGDWWIAGSTFLPEYQPIAWSPDTPEVRQALGIPTPPAGDSDTGSAA